ncbi:MAG: immunoglobulin domain-containing protein [Verrucomicrobia bacterium]|nr:immunoglobulin domain-containing protein [Verrucomicrobiota bacterium]
MKLIRFYPLLLTALLQVLPLARVALTDSLPSAPGASILFKWAAGAIALLGGLHAVVGASAVVGINSPTLTTMPNMTITNGLISSNRFTLTQVFTVDHWTATPLPPGLALNATSGRITGTPTNFLGTMTMVVMAFEGSTALNGATVSTNIFITAVSKPILTNQPVSVTNSTGGTASFNVVAGGTGPLQYQWFSIIAAVTNPVGGTTTNPLLTLPNLTAGQAGSYFAVITNLYGRATSSIATLTISGGTPPAFTAHPADVTAFVGRPAAFSTAATGTAPVSFQWRKDGTNLVNETATNLVLAAVSTNDAGTYDVVASNVTGTNTCLAATLTVVERPLLRVLGLQGQNELMSLPVMPNLTYAIEFATSAAGPWTTLTNLPPVAVATNLTIPDGITTNTARFYRVRSP